MLTAKTRFRPRSSESRVGLHYGHSFFVGKTTGGRKFPPTSGTRASPSEVCTARASPRLHALQSERYTFLSGHASPRQFASSIFTPFSFVFASYCVFLRTVRTAMLNVPPLVLSLAFYGMKKKPFVLKGPKRSFYIRIIKRRVTL